MHSSKYSFKRERERLTNVYHQKNDGFLGVGESNLTWKSPSLVSQRVMRVFSSLR